MSNFDLVNAEGGVNKLLTYKVRGFAGGKGIYRCLSYAVLEVMEAKVDRV